MDLFFLPVLSFSLVTTFSYKVLADWIQVLRHFLYIGEEQNNKLGLIFDPALKVRYFQKTRQIMFAFLANFFLILEASDWLLS